MFIPPCIACVVFCANYQSPHNGNYEFRIRTSIENRKNSRTQRAKRYIKTQRIITRNNNKKNDETPKGASPRKKKILGLDIFCALLQLLCVRVFFFSSDECLSVCVCVCLVKVRTMAGCPECECVCVSCVLNQISAAQDCPLPIIYGHNNAYFALGTVLLRIVC